MHGAVNRGVQPAEHAGVAENKEIKNRPKMKCDSG